LDEETYKQRELEEKYSAEMQSETGQKQNDSKKSTKRKIDVVEEQRKRAEIMIPKKNLWRYKRLMHHEKEKSNYTNTLLDKRKKLEAAESAKKKKKTT